VTDTLSIRRSNATPSCAFLSGTNVGGIVTVDSLRQMATPEWAAKCTALADEIEGPARVALREAARDSERAIARAEKCPPTIRGGT
jgi:hypothetical protein